MNERYIGTQTPVRSCPSDEATLIKKLSEEIGCLRGEIAAMRNEIKRMKSSDG